MLSEGTSCNPIIRTFKPLFIKRSFTRDQQLMVHSYLITKYHRGTLQVGQSWDQFPFQLLFKSMFNNGSCTILSTESVPKWSKKPQPRQFNLINHDVTNLSKRDKYLHIRLVSSPNFYITGIFTAVKRKASKFKFTKSFRYKNKLRHKDKNNEKRFNFN